MHLVAYPLEGADHAVALLLQVRDVDGELLQVGQRVLKQGIRYGKTTHQLRKRHGSAQLLPVGHRWWQSNVPKPLARREKRLAIGVDEERVGVESGGAVVRASVENDTGVGLVGEQVDRATVTLGCGSQSIGKPLQCLWRVNFTGWII